MRYATCETWAEWLERNDGISVHARTIYLRLKDNLTRHKTAKNNHNHMVPVFSEIDIRRACADLIDSSLTQIKAAGFVMVNGVRHGTIPALAHVLGISKSGLFSRLHSSAIQPIRGKRRGGQLCDLWSEPKAREVCADLVAADLPRCDSRGVADIDGVRHRTLASLAEVLGIHTKSISVRLSKTVICPIRGKKRGGQIRDLWPEPAVRKACVDLLGPNLPVCGKNGFACIDGVRHGTIASLARLFGVSIPTIIRSLRRSVVVPSSGKDIQGKPVDLYPEPVIRDLVSHLLIKVPKCGADGFACIDGVRHGSIHSLESLLGVTSKVIFRQIAASGLKPVSGKSSQGRRIDLWPEPRIRELCKDYIGPGILQCNKEDFVMINGICHRTAESFARIFELSPGSVKSRLASSDLVPIRGRIKNGVVNFYPEPAVRELCADLLDPHLPHCDEDGFIDINSIRHGITTAFARILGIDKSTIRSYLVSSGLAPVRGKSKNGALVDLWPEPAVRELCKDVQRRKKPKPKSE